MDCDYHKVVSIIITYKDKIPDKPKPKDNFFSSILNLGPTDGTPEDAMRMHTFFAEFTTTEIIGLNDDMHCTYSGDRRIDNHTTSNITTLGPDKIEHRRCTKCKSFKFDYDSDSEDDNNRQQKNFLAGRKTKTLYENDKWVITNKERQEYYGYGLNLELVDNIVKVWYNVVEGCSRKQK